jgi:hypothetical protein
VCGSRENECWSEKGVRDSVGGAPRGAVQLCRVVRCWSLFCVSLVQCRSCPVIDARRGWRRAQVTVPPPFPATAIHSESTPHPVSYNDPVCPIKPAIRPPTFWKSWTSDSADAPQGCKPHMRVRLAQYDGTNRVSLDDTTNPVCKARRQPWK